MNLNLDSLLLILEQTNTRFFFALTIKSYYSLNKKEVTIEDSITSKSLLLYTHDTILNQYENIIRPYDYDVHCYAFIMDKIVKKGDLDTTLFFFTNFIAHIKITNFMCCLAKYGHTHILKAFHRVEREKWAQSLICYNAIENGHLDIIKYLLDEYKYSIDSVSVRILVNANPENEMSLYLKKRLNIL